MGTLRRFQHTATPRDAEWAIRSDLRAARRALLRGRVEEARPFIDRAHDASQNSPVLHTRAHLGRSLLHAWDRRPGALVRELPLIAMAPTAAMVRRAAGLMPGEDGGIGLLATWRMRRDPPSVSDPLARPLRVSDEGS